MKNLNKEKLISKKKISLFTPEFNDISLVKKEQYLINEARFYPASNKEWLNSIYSYNKSISKSLPVKDKIVYNLLKSYFNLKINRIKNVSNNKYLNISSSSLFALAKKRLSQDKWCLLADKTKRSGANLHILKQWKKNLNLANVNLNKQLVDVNEKNAFSNLFSLDKIGKINARFLFKLKQRLLKKTRIQEKKKKLFLKKTYLSLPEIKHLNHKSIITVSIYNRNNQILKKKINKLYNLFISETTTTTTDNRINLLNLREKNINTLSYPNQEKRNSIINFFKITLYKKIYLLTKKTLLEKSFDFNKDKLFITSSDYLVSDVKKINLRKLKKIQKILQKKYKKLTKYRYLIMLLCFYKFRLNNSNLLGLKNITRKIYGKKIVFRIINLKYMYLDSNILAEAITKKLRDRKKKILRVLKKVMGNIRKVTLVKNLWEDNLTSEKFMLSNNSNIEQENNLNPIYNNVNSRIYSKTPITDLIDNEYLLDKSEQEQKNQMKGLILYNLKHKLVSGIKVQGSGRLTKRLTASRSVTKFRSKGSLKNIDSSRNGVTNVMVRGNLKSNLQYVNINKYNRNGSFGVKSWISSY